MTPGQQNYIKGEILEALSSGRWMHWKAIYRRVRKRFEWADDDDVIEVLDDLGDEEITISRHRKDKKDVWTIEHRLKGATK